MIPIKLCFSAVKYGYNDKFALLGNVFRFSTIKYFVGLYMLLVCVCNNCSGLTVSTSPGSTFGKSLKVCTLYVFAVNV